MIFLIQYDRLLGQIIQIKRFDDINRHMAEDARLTLEIQLSRDGIANEVVLLEASSEEALRKTHARYFNDIKKLLESTSSQSLSIRLSILVRGDKTNINDAIKKCLMSGELISARLWDYQETEIKTIILQLAPSVTIQDILLKLKKTNVEVLESQELSRT